MAVMQYTSMTDLESPASLIQAAMMPKRRLEQTEQRKWSPSSAQLRRLSAKPAPAKMDVKPEKAAWKDKSSDQNCKQRGLELQRADRRKWLTSKPPICLWKMETENQSPASKEEKEAKSDKALLHLSEVPVSLVQSKGNFF